MSDKVEKFDENPRIANNEEPTGEATCKINFENDQNRVYYTGQVVSGQIELTINETITVRAIYANVVGRGYCIWANKSKEEIYFNRKIYYVGGRNNSSSGNVALDRKLTVEPGEYKYLFDCNIPDECHTSVEEATGYIRYSVTVVIEEEVDRKKEFVETFTVINPLNLNDDEAHSYPMSDEAEFTFTKYCCCCCCWETEPVKFSVQLPKKGYAPGEGIEITINVNNKSDQTYDKFSGNIFKKIEFHTNGKTFTSMTSTEKLATFDCEGCPAGESLSRTLIVTVPSTPPSETSSICSISYQLTVEALADLCREDLKLEFPLTIGTYPIHNSTASRTGDIVVSQQPKPTKVPLLNENLITSSQQATIEHRKPNMTVQPHFRVGESSRSDKDLGDSYRPMYPTYCTNSQYPLAFTVKVEAGETKPIKMC